MQLPVSVTHALYLVHIMCITSTSPCTCIYAHYLCCLFLSSKVLWCGFFDDNLCCY